MSKLIFDPQSIPVESMAGEMPVKPELLVPDWLRTRFASAVLRYPPAERRCPPWLLVREEGRWRLDLATASRAIRFGRDNSWRFDAGAPPAYAFAFADWSFDAHGFAKAAPGS